MSNGFTGFIAKKHIPRRTFLRGAGVALGLPFLDSMVPAQTPLAQTAANPIRRMGFVYVPHGMIMAQFTPIHEGTDFKFTRILQPLEPYKDRLVIVTGLHHKHAYSENDGGDDHGRSPSVWLTGVHPKATESEDVRAGTTIDQMAAAQIGQTTIFPSLEVATEDTTGLVGACASGYSCTYINTVSWRTPTTPNPMEINPRVVFDRLVGEGRSPEERLARMKQDESILDRVTGKLNRVKASLGPADQLRFDEYLENIREIERRIQLSEKHSSTQIGVPESPAGIPESWDEHSKLMFDLQALAFQADLTRVSTFMMARELSSRSYPWIGFPDAHHSTSHHQNDPVKIEKLAKLQTYHLSLFGYFLNKLRSTQDGEGNLLDHSLLLYGSCMSNSNVHDHGPLPVVVAGGAAGRMKGYRHLKYPDQTPMSNLLLTLLDKMDVRPGSVGDSTGLLANL